MKKQIIRNRPRISAPKIGEYIVVGPNRRERIVFDQKFPASFVVGTYKEAHTLARRALLARGEVSTALLQSAERLDQRPARSKYEADARRCSAQALRRLAKLYVSLGIDGDGFTLTATLPTSVSIEGVKISVAPVVRVSKRSRGGQLTEGAVLLVFRKTSALQELSGAVVGEILRRSLVQAGVGAVTPSLCIVVDVFAGVVFRPPSRNKRLSDEIASACREIAVRWEALVA